MTPDVILLIKLRVILISLSTAPLHWWGRNITASAEQDTEQLALVFTIRQTSVVNVLLTYCVAWQFYFTGSHTILKQSLAATLWKPVGPDQRHKARLYSMVKMDRHAHKIKRLIHPLFVYYPESCCSSMTSILNI